MAPRASSAEVERARWDGRVAVARVVVGAAGTVVLTVLGLLPVELAVAALGLGGGSGIAAAVGRLLKGRLKS
jgi:hypothetical protein